MWRYQRGDNSPARVQAPTRFIPPNRKRGELLFLSYRLFLEVKPSNFLHFLVKAVPKWVFRPESFQELFGFLEGFLIDVAGPEQLPPSERDLVGGYQA